MTYYIKGGSRFNEANPTVWVALNLLGFADSKYLDSDWKQIDFESIIDDDDPFWLMGSTTGGAKELELGLYNDYRIKFETTGITYWDGDSWENLLGVGGDLNDVGDVIISGTPADNEVLAYDSSSGNWINQTAAEAGLATSGHLHDGATLQHDGVNSNGGAFPFTTTGNVTFSGPSDNTLIVVGSATCSLQLQNGTRTWALIGDNSPDFIGLYDYGGGGYVFQAIGNGGNFEIGRDVVILNTKKLILNNLTAGEVLEIYSSNTTSGWFYINQVNDGELEVNGFHAVRFGTNDGGYGLRARLTTSALDMSVPIAMGGNDITFTLGNLEYGQSVPTGTPVLGWNGHFYATKIYNAVYNDYADYWKAEHGVRILPGYCYSIHKKGLIITKKRADKACMGICTDTYGMAVGQQYHGVPISIGGFLLAHCDKKYKPGTLLLSNEKGKLTKARFYEKRRAIAKYMFKETKTKTRGIWVNDRHWVKVL